MITIKLHNPDEDLPLWPELADDPDVVPSNPFKDSLFMVYVGMDGLVVKTRMEVTCNLTQRSAFCDEFGREMVRQIGRLVVEARKNNGS